MKKILFITFILIILITIIGWLGLKNSFNPLLRKTINNPIYTIGDLNYKKALDQGKQIIKFGPAFWGIYPGGLAFNDIKNAETFFNKEKSQFTKVSDKWAIYKLSGDFDIDVIKRNNNSYLNKSLFVIKTVKNL